jgi:REP element-mobilizing transposase RayT
VVFSTKGRVRSIGTELQPKLWAYLRGIARNTKVNALAIGGMEDHVHSLIEIPADLALAKAVQLMKGNSSKWLNEMGMNFAWQQGYAAFSVSGSHVQAVCEYIRNQREHHKRYSYEQELMALLRKNGLNVSEAEVLG